MPLALEAGALLTVIHKSLVLNRLTRVIVVAAYGKSHAMIETPVGYRISSEALMGGANHSEPFVRKTRTRGVARINLMAY